MNQRLISAPSIRIQKNPGFTDISVSEKLLVGGNVLIGARFDAKGNTLIPVQPGGNGRGGPRGYRGPTGPALSVVGAEGWLTQIGPDGTLVPADNTEPAKIIPCPGEVGVDSDRTLFVNQNSEVVYGPSTVTTYTPVQSTEVGNPRIGTAPHIRKELALSLPLSQENEVNLLTSSSSTGPTQRRDQTSTFNFTDLDPSHPDVTMSTMHLLTESGPGSANIKWATQQTGSTLFLDTVTTPEIDADCIVAGSTETFMLNLGLGITGHTSIGIQRLDSHGANLLGILGLGPVGATDDSGNGEPSVYVCMPSNKGVTGQVLEIVAGNGSVSDPHELIWSTNAGAKGDTGPVGPTGSVGLHGPTGPAGTHGSTGSQGLSGSTGPTGSGGPRGSTGPAGTHGSTGSQGLSGPTGPRGPTGDSTGSGLWVGDSEHTTLTSSTKVLKLNAECIEIQSAEGPAPVLTVELVAGYNEIPNDLYFSDVDANTGIAKPALGTMALTDWVSATSSCNPLMADGSPTEAFGDAAFVTGSGPSNASIVKYSHGALGEGPEEWQVASDFNGFIIECYVTKDGKTGWIIVMGTTVTSTVPILYQRKFQYGSGIGSWVELTELSNALHAVGFTMQVDFQFHMLMDITWIETDSGIQWFFSGAPGIFYNTTKISSSEMMANGLSNWDSVANLAQVWHMNEHGIIHKTEDLKATTGSQGISGTFGLDGWPQTLPVFGLSGGNHNVLYSGLASEDAPVATGQTNVAWPNTLGGSQNRKVLSIGQANGTAQVVIAGETANETGAIVNGKLSVSGSTWTDSDWETVQFIEGEGNDRGGMSVAFAQGPNKSLGEGVWAVGGWCGTPVDGIADSGIWISENPSVSPWKSVSYSTNGGEASQWSCRTVTILPLSPIASRIPPPCYTLPKEIPQMDTGFYMTLVPTGSTGSAVAKWTSLGPTGSAGIPGPQGPAGAQGPAGPTGSTPYRFAPFMQTFTTAPVGLVPIPPGALTAKITATGGGAGGVQPSEDTPHAGGGGGGAGGTFIGMLAVGSVPATIKIASIASGGAVGSPGDDTILELVGKPASSRYSNMVSSPSASYDIIAKGGSLHPTSAVQGGGHGGGGLTSIPFLNSVLMSGEDGQGSWVDLETGAKGGRGGSSYWGGGNASSNAAATNSTYGAGGGGGTSSSVQDSEIATTGKRGVVVIEWQ